MVYDVRFSSACSDGYRMHLYILIPEFMTLFWLSIAYIVSYYIGKLSHIDRRMPFGFLSLYTRSQKADTLSAI